LFCAAQQHISGTPCNYRKERPNPMPKLKPDIQRARREHILEAAERCFANAGFHRTTMHDICKEAAVSPGALYVYFDSKEALIAGIAGRDRAEFAERLAALSDAPDFLKALEAWASTTSSKSPPTAGGCASRSAWSRPATRASARSSRRSTASWHRASKRSSRA
jgi:AcrR family transcriptional regulator